MSNKVFKYIKILSWILMSCGVLSLVYLIAMSYIKPEPSMMYPSGSGTAEGSDWLINYTYILGIIALLAALAFPVINLVSKPKSTKRSLIGLAGIIVLLVLAYFISDSTPLPLSDGSVFDNKWQLVFSDMIVYVTYAVALIAFLVIIVTSIRKSLK